MNSNETNIEILKINNYLKKCLWMDFEFAKMDGGNITVAGRIDTSYDEFAINIEFGNPFYISSVLSWHLDDSKPFIEVIDEDEKQKIYDKYQVEQGYYVFRINAEDFTNSPIIIVSKTIKCEIVNENPF